MEKTLLDNIEFLIKDEHEAIDGYNKVINFVETSSYEQKDVIIKQLEHIKEEEEEHIKELEELKKMVKNVSYVPKLDTLKEDLDNFSLKSACRVAKVDLDNGIESAMMFLSETYGFDVSYYFNKMNVFDDEDESGIDGDTGEHFSNANIYYRDKQFEKLGIYDLMQEAYDLVWEQNYLRDEDGEMVILDE